MLDRLPILIDPLKLSERNKILSGTVKTSELARLSEILLDNSGLVEIDFSFSKEGKRSIIQGKLKADLALECQTCLGQVNCPIDIEFKLGLASSLEDSDKLADDCEPLILQDVKIPLNQLVEDELLLALPDFPRHQNDCMISHHASLAVDDNEQLNSDNPFSILTELKNTGD